MKATEMLNQVKNLLGVELTDVQLAELKLQNGTVLEAESFESGKEVFIKTEDENVALPVGSYELEDNQILVVEEEGVIKEIKAQEEEEEKEEDKEELKYVTREEFKKEMDELKDMVKKMMKPEDKQEMSSEEVSLAVTEVLEEDAKLKEELSKPATEPIKHSPEEGVKSHNFKFATKRNKSTLDRVMESLSNK